MRVEHVAEPVQDDLATGLFDQAPIHPEVIVWRLRKAAQGTTRHQNGQPATGLDMRLLFLVSRGNGVQAFGRRRVKLVSAGAAGEIGALDRAPCCR